MLSFGYASWHQASKPIKHTIMGILRSIQSKKKVFVIDDNPMYRTMVQNELAQIAEVDVQVFASAEESLQETGCIPSLVVLDLYLDDGSNSVMSGHDAIDKFRELNENIAVLLVSGERNEALLQDYKDYRGVDFITKENHIGETLQALVKDHLFIK